jgi:Raf kinase inhibitor-like YbhB/YbcL family protein
MTMTISSTAFKDGQSIPKKYTEDGEDLSPPLKWEGVPDGIKELALIVDDPDAPTSKPWVHWVLYQIPADVRELPEGLPSGGRLEKPIKVLQGRNSWSSGRTIGYRGPAPPHRHGVHHYHFKLYAIDTSLNLYPSLDMASAAHDVFLPGGSLRGGFVAGICKPPSASSAAFAVREQNVEIVVPVHIDRQDAHDPAGTIELMQFPGGQISEISGGFEPTDHRIGFFRAHKEVDAVFAIDL